MAALPALLAAYRPAAALKVLKLVSAAGSLTDLSFIEPAVYLSVWPHRDDATALSGADDVLLKAACTALRLIAAQDVRSPPTSDQGWAALKRAFSCTDMVFATAVGLVIRLTHQWQPALTADDEAAVKGLMQGAAAAGATAAAHLQQPRRAGQGAVEADCMVAWLRMGQAVLLAATPVARIMGCTWTARGRAPAWCAAEASALSSVLPRLATAVLQTDAALTSDGMPAAVVNAWGSAIRFTQHPMLKKGFSGSTAASTAQPGDNSLPGFVDSDVAELVALHLGLYTAALHQQQAGRSSSVAADPVAAAGLSSSSSGSGSGGSSSQPPTQLAVPGFHQALLRQVPCQGVMLAQPDVIEVLLDGRTSLALPHQPAAVRASGRLVPVLQVLVELAVLHADSSVLVQDAVASMLQLVQHSSDPAAAGSRSDSQGTPLHLQPVQAAGLLAPVLHLLSAAVLHVLGGSAAGGAADPLASDLAGRFAALVAAVVSPVEPQHLAAAICRQPLRSLAALELTLRLWAAGLVPQLEGAVAADGAPLVLKLAVTVAEACSTAVYSSKLAAVLQGSDSVAVSLVHNHLLALLSTCLKVCTRARGSAAVCVQSGAVRIAVNVGDAALGVVEPTSALWPDTSSSSNSQAAISRCGTTHWLVIMGRSLVEFSQRSMQLVSSQLLQEGELPAASAAGAAAIIQAAGHAATRPGATPPGAALSLQRVDVAAASAGGGSLLMLCHGDITRPGETDASLLSVMLRQLRDSLAQQQQACSSSGATSGPQPETLQQLAHAASDVQQQLDGWCAAARRAALEFNEASQHSAEALVRCYIMAMSQNSDGVTVLLDAQGQPIARQHGLLNVLHHLQRLHRLGEAVCAALPPPSLACANPGCANVSGLSDMQLVWRRGVCGHCREARFCSAACLRSHWAAHRNPGSVVAAVLGGGV